MSIGQTYIGVTGIAEQHQVHTLANLEGWHAPRNEGRIHFMNGILMSQTTLLGRTPARFPRRYPHRERVPQLFSPEPHVINVIHYSTPDPKNLVWELLAMMGMYGPHIDSSYTTSSLAKLHGFQLNIAWPEISLLSEFKDMLSARGINISLIVQIGSSALKQIEHDPKALAGMVKQYEQVAEYVLLDASGGRGIELDTRVLQQYLQDIHEVGADIGVGIAGGLSEHTLSCIEPLLQIYPEISIDAEGQLRDKDDQFILRSAQNYVSTGLRMYAHHA